MPKTFLDHKGHASRTQDKRIPVSHITADIEKHLFYCLNAKYNIRLLQIYSLDLEIVTKINVTFWCLYSKWLRILSAEATNEK